ncbi:hypothetical protein NCER_101410 [Vairimorpha ceranae BRL01]|uniref:Uncharacterized protein n=2 Tax=Vairimorpha ceranae TaxID=40302 RepID=C4V9Y6_VAIC1|nr:hypothetical protein AAJ76_7400012901 [Vairimorpha ceranae]EEQ81967.1 hypothetical protein NCER_101410 [Vairimorpha ceranae BRL01]KAF5140870.1 hypothetical protein G9O61_00g009770 [Vairimorpha ceranae]KAF5141025.1 hypothetical protein G9O61_00g008090 [Vairimorpha ceranae]KKO74420.1 hypothetical protein AAJ76_7400012901 [Vairimorpha ceranae]
MLLLKKVGKIILILLVVIGSLIVILELLGYSIFEFLKPKMSLSSTNVGKFDTEIAYQLYLDNCKLKKINSLSLYEFDLMVKALRIIVDINIKSLSIAKTLKTKFFLLEADYLKKKEKLDLTLDNFQKTNDMLKTNLFNTELSKSTFLSSFGILFEFRINDKDELFVPQNYIIHNKKAYQELKELCAKKADKDLQKALFHERAGEVVYNFNYIQIMFTNWIEYLFDEFKGNGDFQSFLF